MIPFFISMVMSFGTACAKDIQTVLITRFFTGLFGVAPITCTGGVYVDIWPASQRGNAIVGYTLAVCGGPVGRVDSSSKLEVDDARHLVQLLEAP